MGKEIYLYKVYAPL